MPYKQLYIFVEGPDDKRFFENIIKPLFTSQYDYLYFISYSTLSNAQRKNFIKSLQNQIFIDYLIIGDFDARGNLKHCKTKCKSSITKKFGNIANNDKIFIVVEEIESWYLAGIKESKLKLYKINKYTDTQFITKENFVSLIPKQFLSVSDFMIDILKDYSITKAKVMNKSLNYFLTKNKLKT